MNSIKIRNQNRCNTAAIPVTGRERPWLWDVEAPIFCIKSVHRWGWCCQPYVPAVLYLPGRFLVLISARGWVDSSVIVRLKGLGQFKKTKDLIVIRTRGLPACSIMREPTTLQSTYYFTLSNYRNKIFIAKELWYTCYRWILEAEASCHSQFRTDTICIAKVVLMQICIWLNWFYILQNLSFIIDFEIFLKRNLSTRHKNLGAF
jgi:hypothetical protein